VAGVRREADTLDVSLGGKKGLEAVTAVGLGGDWVMLKMDSINLKSLVRTSNPE